MKKEERMHRLFGNIDDDLVTQAIPRPINLRVWIPRIVAAAAVIALTVGLTVSRTDPDNQPPTQDGIVGHTPATDTTTTTTSYSTTITKEPSRENDTSTTIVSPHTGGTPTSTASTEGGVWYEPKWEEKPIWQRFPEFERTINSKMRYTVRNVNIDKSMVEEPLEEVNLRGYDIYTETTYDMVGKVYRIKGINPVCAVALQYPDRSDFFPAVNSGYKPATLGEFITDLNLREHLRVGIVYHSYRDADGTLHDRQYAGLTAEKVWEMLLSDNTLRNEYDEEDWQAQWNTKISIRIDMPLLGYQNISISLSEDGYLRTNLLDTEKAFHIGTDKVEDFMTYVQNHCRVQETLIALPNGDATSGTTVSTAKPPYQPGTTIAP